jgi:hypothetical protein
MTSDVIPPRKPLRLFVSRQQFESRVFEALTAFVA